MIVVFGTVCLDRVRRLPNLPGPGGYVEVTEETVVLGGEAANTALALAAWGERPRLASNPLGDDAEGQDLRTRVLRRGLDLCELRGKRPSPSPVCDVLVTPDGERTMIGRGFSSLDPAIDLDALPLASSGLFAADPNFPEAAREAARRALRADMRTYLMDFLREDEPLGLGSVLHVSAEDVGVRGDPAAASRLADAIVARTGAHAILTDGRRGLVAGAPGLAARPYPAFPAPSVVDATGAGDVFRAGVLYGLAKEWPLGDCLRFAAAAGAVSVGFPGASTRLPTLREIADLIADGGRIGAQYA